MNDLLATLFASSRMLFYQPPSSRKYCCTNESQKSLAGTVLFSPKREQSRKACLLRPSGCDSLRTICYLLHSMTIIIYRARCLIINRGLALLACCAEMLNTEVKSCVGRFLWESSSFLRMSNLASRHKCLSVLAIFLFAVA